MKKLNDYLVEGEVEDKIKNFFIKNPSPSDDEVHDFAESLKINTHRFEEHIYKLLGTLLKEKK